MVAAAAGGLETQQASPSGMRPAGMTETSTVCDSYKLYAGQTDVWILKMLDAFDYGRLGLVQPRRSFLNRLFLTLLLGVLESVRLPLRLKLVSVFVRTVIVPVQPREATCFELHLRFFFLRLAKQTSWVTAPQLGTACLTHTYVNTLSKFCLQEGPNYQHRE